jgi:hypothetical protein
MFAVKILAISTVQNPMFDVKIFSLSDLDHFNSARIVCVGHVLFGFRKKLDSVKFCSGDNGDSDDAGDVATVVTQW